MSWQDQGRGAGEDLPNLLGKVEGLDMSSCGVSRVLVETRERKTGHFTAADMKKTWTDQFHPLH